MRPAILPLFHVCIHSLTLYEKSLPSLFIGISTHRKRTCDMTSTMTILVESKTLIASIGGNIGGNILDISFAMRIPMGK